MIKDDLAESSALSLIYAFSTAFSAKHYVEISTDQKTLGLGDSVRELPVLLPQRELQGVPHLPTQGTTAPTYIIEHQNRNKYRL